MAFMKAYVYQGKFWLVETTHGTECVPFDVESDSTRLSVYVDGEIEEIPDGPHAGFYGRYSADGYMDCTSWHWGASEADVLAELERAYGDDGEYESANE